MDKNEILRVFEEELPLLRDADSVTFRGKERARLAEALDSVITLLSDGKTPKKMPPKTNFSPSDDIDSLGLSKRTAFALRRSGYMTVKDVRKLDKTRLKEIKGIGAKCMHEVIEKALEHGIYIG